MPSQTFKLDGDDAKYLQGRKSMKFTARDVADGVQLGCPEICLTPAPVSPCETCTALPSLITLTLPSAIDGISSEVRYYDAYTSGFAPARFEYSTSTIYDKWEQFAAGSYTLRQCACEWKLLRRTGFTMFHHDSYLIDPVTIDVKDDILGGEAFDISQTVVKSENRCENTAYATDDSRTSNPDNIVHVRTPGVGSPITTYWEHDSNTLDNNFTLTLTDLGGGTVKATVTVFASVIVASTARNVVDDATYAQDGSAWYNSGDESTLLGPPGGGESNPIWNTGIGFGCFKFAGTVYQVSDRIIYEGNFTCGTDRSVTLTTTGPANYGLSIVAGAGKLLQTALISSWPSSIELSW